jgi:hypothetical protein
LHRVGHVFLLPQETENPRQRGCVAGNEETLELDQTRQTQVTSAREASDSGDNKVLFLA